MTHGSDFTVGKNGFSFIETSSVPKLSLLDSRSVGKVRDGRHEKSQ